MNTLKTAFTAPLVAFVLYLCYIFSLVLQLSVLICWLNIL